MELQDFTEKEQTQIKSGLSTAEITDKEAAKKTSHHHVTSYVSITSLVEKS